MDCVSYSFISVCFAVRNISPTPELTLILREQMMLLSLQSSLMDMFLLMKRVMLSSMLRGSLTEQLVIFTRKLWQFVAFPLLGY